MSPYSYEDLLQPKFRFKFEQIIVSTKFVEFFRAMLFIVKWKSGEQIPQFYT